MKLSAILKQYPQATVTGLCRKCGYAGQAKAIRVSLDGKALQACPKCHSVNFRIDLVTIPSGGLFPTKLYERTQLT